SNRPMAAGDDAARQQKIGIFWSLVDSLLNVLLFVLLGFELIAMNMSELAVISVAAAIPLALLSRFLSIGLPFWTFRLQPGGWQTPCLLTWVGLRGAISVALVQIMPEGPYNEALTAA